MPATVLVVPKNPRTKYMALDFNDQSKIVAEGTTIKSVIRKAEKTGRRFILMPVLEGNCTYIF